MSRSMEEVDMKQLIQFVNQIQDYCSSLGGSFKLNFDLPQIAVIGSQSVGKSSVLENFVGRDFLPRGSGIVTRCPLILQFFNMKGEEFGEFLHKPGVRFTNFSDLRKEIEDETRRKVGNSDNISPKPINLRIYSENVLDLTLIDLPGITRVAIGDQPENIEEQLKALILEFIKKDNCLILAVSAANQDLSTSDALNLAKIVDPDRSRTIGVITKLDLMDHGTDARDILDNNIDNNLKLKRGYIGVVNRSQADIHENKCINEALKKEQEFFESHPAYKSISNRLGTPYLQKFLNRELTQHIKNVLPNLIDKFRFEMSQLQKEIEKRKLLMNPEDSKTKCFFEVLKQVNLDFQRKIGLTIRSNDCRTRESDNIASGTMIKYTMNNKYRHSIEKITPSVVALRKEIASAIAEIQGVFKGLFIADAAFDRVVCSQIECFEEPSYSCIDVVVEELRKIIKACCNKARYFPKLRDAIEFEVFEFIEKLHKDVENQFMHRLDIEATYINTDHEDFIGLKGAIDVIESKHSKLHQFMREMQAIAKPTQINELNSMKVMQYREEAIALEGWLTVSSAKRFWFVLTDKSLSCFTEKNKEKQICSLKIRNNTFFVIAGTTITFYTISQGEDTSNTLKVILYTESEVELKTWIDAFHLVWVFEFIERPNSVNEHIENRKQIEIIEVLVDSYLRIVKKGLHDIMPKLLLNSLIYKVKEFLSTDLHIKLLARDMQTLMTLDSDEERSRLELVKKYGEYQRASKLIQSFLSDNSITISK